MEKIDWTSLLQLGFSFAVAGWSLYYIKEREEVNDSRIDNLNLLHKEEITTISKAVENNTEAILQLTEIIRKEKE